MGQYYIAVILADSVPKDGEKEIIRLAVNGHSYRCGAKLTEHSWLSNKFVSVIEWLISPGGIFYKSRLAWSGDYANNEPNEDSNLYHKVINGEYPMFIPPDEFHTELYRYIVNHTKHEYVDKNKRSISAASNNDIMHPLPLLVSEGNGNGGGDYFGPNNELCGRWARDIISVETVMPYGYTELVCDFSE